jgi:hypothetical protein
MLGDGVNENIMQLSFVDKRYYSMLSALIHDIQNSNYYGDKDTIMASPTAVADLVETILSESERYEVTTLHVVWTIILWMFGNFLQKNLYDVRLYGGTGYSILHHRRLPQNGTLKNFTTRILSALLVKKIVYSLTFFFNDQDAQQGGGGGGGEEDHEGNDTTKWFANYFVTGFSSIVFEILVRRIQLSAIVSTMLFLFATVVGIVVVLNSDIIASLLPDIGYENEKDSISIFTICGFCLLLAGWHCCAGITTRIFGYKKMFLSSFSCFLLVIAILTLPSLQNLIFEILGSIWKYFGEIL